MRRCASPHHVVHDVGVGDDHRAGAGGVAERRVSGEHLVGAHSHRPPVALGPEAAAAARVVAVHPQQHLGADVVGRAHRHVGHRLRGDTGGESGVWCGRADSNGVDSEAPHGIGTELSRYRSIDLRLGGSILTLFLDTGAESIFSEYNQSF